MVFLCPDCDHNTLKIEAALELPPDALNDELTLQTVACGQCGLQALAVYGESRRGALDAESWWHEGYRVAEADYQAVSAAISRCPAPARSGCRCETHRELGQRNGMRWDGLRQRGVEIDGVFEMRWVGADVRGGSF